VRHATTGDEVSALLLAARTEPRAFGEVFELVNDDLLAYFYRRCFDAHAANDLAQETLARALVHLDRFDPARGNGTQWLWGIAHRELMTWFRKGKAEARARERVGMRLLPLPDDALEHIESLVDAQDLQAALADALAGLSPSLRRTVELRVGQGLGYEELATELGCSVGAARVRVARALARLQLALGDPPATEVSA
jgi:RNA polymerase sigma factor (sigma-70 family)